MLRVLKGQNDSAASPWARCSRHKLADVLSQAGTADGVRTRNRGALYDLANAFEKGARKRVRDSASSPASSPDGSPAADAAATRQAPRASASAEATGDAEMASGAVEDDEAAAALDADVDTPVIDTVVSDLVAQSLEAAKQGKLAQSSHSRGDRGKDQANAGGAHLGVAAGSGVSKKQRKREKRAAAAARHAETAINGELREGGADAAVRSAEDGGTTAHDGGAVPAGALADSDGAHATAPAANGAVANAADEVARKHKKKKNEAASGESGRGGSARIGDNARVSGSGRSGAEREPPPERRRRRRQRAAHTGRC